MNKTKTEELLIISKLSAIPVVFTLITVNGIHREYELSMHNSELCYRTHGHLVRSAYSFDATVNYILTGEHSFGTDSIHTITGMRLAE